MHKVKFAYMASAVALLLVAVLLYAKGFHLKSGSFGLGLSYILPAVACLGLAFVAGIMALLESASTKLPSHTSHR